MDVLMCVFKTVHQHIFIYTDKKRGGPASNPLPKYSHRNLSVRLNKPCQLFLVAAE